jgi:hypothetical protein
MFKQSSHIVQFHIYKIQKQAKALMIEAEDAFDQVGHKQGFLFAGGTLCHGTGGITHVLALVVILLPYILLAFL